MRRLLRNLTFARVLLAALALGAPTASAKILPSVVLDSAATDTTVILRESDPDLERLNELLPPWPMNTHAPTLAKGISPDTGRQITVLWRGDRDTVVSAYAVLPDYLGSAWVRASAHLLVSSGMAARRDGDDWQKAKPGLLPLLERHGLYDPSAQSASEAGRETGAAAGAKAAQVSAGDNWWWAGPGLAVGLLIGAVGARLIRRAGRESPAGAAAGGPAGGPPGDQLRSIPG
ncbi:hypothetical protein [Streptomyces sp. NBC_01304]|uniref:hypothetical protein n=1 Tax=Streptomyces sp. NBC_01304 TaxID=2903818 RepID=UPI002E128B90|nr:hypothetical protein OG430_20115 [Streptomyces sp. NBC_01304]